MGRISLSLSIIFGVVPVPTSEWNPDMAPHAMVMNANGYNGPGTIGPPPLTYSLSAGMCSTGLASVTPTTSSATVPTFMKALR